MCRFIAYLGKPVLMEELLYRPQNSLIKQSTNAQEMARPLNGDGFGIGWYNHDIDFKPGLFVSIQPAWNDLNLLHIASRIRSSCFFAHVRAASHGVVNALNCHPFQYKQFLFMHNGGIAGFQQIKRSMRKELSDDIYNWLQGQTDSEHFFALFLNLLMQKPNSGMPQVIAETLQQTILLTESIKQAAGVYEPSTINVAITDGFCMVAVRYISDTKLPAASLHYSIGSLYECDETGTCHMRSAANTDPGAVIIASEKLSSYQAEWLDVPANHLLIIDKYLGIRIQELKL